MKKHLFNKAAALVMGSLMIFSGQALAFSSNNQKLTNAERLGESEHLIAQSPGSQALTPKEKNDLAAAVAAVEPCLSQAERIIQAAAIPKSQKDAIAGTFSQVKSIFGPALAQAAAGAQTKRDAQAIAQAFSQAESVLGPALAQFQALANSPGGETLASCFGPANAKIQAIAR